MTNNVRPGTQHLFDRAEPALETGRYALERVHDVLDGPGGDVLVDGGTDRLIIDVEGPRVSLQPADILGMFPAPGETDALTERVAHIALRRRTLPWERGFTSHDHYPWMMLLLFTADEVEVRRGTLGDMGRSYPGLSASTPVNWIEVGRSVLRKTVPHRDDEVPFLAHLRRVSRRDQEGQKDDDGDIAMVLGNRLPEPREPDATSGVEHIACLVSLEGEENASWWPSDEDMESEELFPDTSGDGALTFVRRLSDGRLERVFRAEFLAGVHLGTVATADPVHRLLLLHHWTFRSGIAGDFQTRVSRLGFRQESDGSLPKTGGTEAFGASLAGSHGHARVDHRGRGGDPGVGLYRGPLSTTAGALLDEDDVALSADELRVQVGGDTERINDAAAFELGRLMALADPAFLRALIEWRRRRARGTAGTRVVRELVERTKLTDLIDERHFRPERLLFEHPADGLLGRLIDDLRGGGVIDPSPLDQLRSDPTDLAVMGTQVAGLDHALVQEMKGDAALAALDPSAAPGSFGGILQPGTTSPGDLATPGLLGVDVASLGGILGHLETALIDFESVPGLGDDD